MTFTFLNLLDIIGFVQGILLGIILILSYKRNPAIPFLGIFLIGYSLDFPITLLDENGYLEAHPELLFLPLNGYFLFMPALYLYAKSILQKFNWQKDFIHFIPAILEFICFGILFTFPATTKLTWYDSGMIDLFLIPLVYFFILGYSITIIRLINRHKKVVVNYFSSIQGKTLQWVKWICYYVLYTLALVISPIFLQENYEELLFPVFSIINVVFIFWVALNGFRQVFISVPPQEFITEIPPTKSNNSANIDNPNLREYKALLSFMEKERPFTNPHLQLSELAKQLNYPSRKLSNLINEVGNLNFNQFINQFRVEAAKKLLLDPEMRHLNLLGIAYQVGFNSKTSFYTTFKQAVGQTPNQFKKQASLLSNKQ